MTINYTLSLLNIHDKNLSSYASASGWLGNKDNELTSLNPSNGNPIASVYVASQQDYATIMQDALVSQSTWREVPAPKRGELIRLLGNELRSQKDALGNLVSMEMGKIKQEGDGEVQEMIDMADFAVGQSRMMYGKTMHSERPQHRMYEQWHPLGVVGVISAFNFPVAVWAWNAFMAAITGNVVVWKPSTKVPLCAIAVQHICNTAMQKAGFPGIFSLFIPHQDELIQNFVEDSNIPLISFTGSSRTGKKVALKVARRFGRSLLECSGNNAVIVDQDADLDIAIPAIVFGAIGTAGQRCTSTRRLFVHDQVYELVLERLLKAYAQIKIGDAMDNSVLLGPLIDQPAIEQYLTTIEQIKRQAGKVLFGGTRLSHLGAGNFVQPVLASVPGQTKIVTQETFAPILYVLKFKQLTTAIELQNAVPQGLSSAIFTNNLRHAELFLSAQGSDCGIANVNIGTSGAEIGGAFGGEKSTGGGREAGSDSWKAYMRRQTNCINWGSDLPLAQGIKFTL